MTTTLEQRAFVENEILSRTIRGAFQRVHIYDKVSKDDDRGSFREKVKKSLQRCAAPYRTQKVSPHEHLENIDCLRGDLKIVSFGVAQKLLNLYLKCLWCVGYLYDTPPHCPVDSIILAKIKSPVPRWPSLDRENYEERIRAIESLARQEGIGVAEWELSFFNEANPTYTRQRKSIAMSVLGVHKGVGNLSRKSENISKKS